MKVLLVNKFHYLKGGSEKYYFTLADGLKKAGHDVVFFAMKDERNYAEGSNEFFVDNVSADGGIKSKLKMIFGMRYSKKAYKKMQGLLKKEKPDLVILNLVHKQITCSVIDAIKDYDKNIPVFWVMHDLITVCPAYTMLNGEGKPCDKCLGGDFRHCVKNKCIRGSGLLSYLSFREAKFIAKKKFYDKVDLFICPSQFYEKVLKSAEFTRSEIKFIRNPLTEESFSSGGKDGGYFLYFGRLSAEKGIARLILAAKKAGVTLKIVGEGAEEEKLKELAKGGDISFEGYKSGKELDEYVLNAKAVVIPSEWNENCPYSAAESMAKGKPLIVSDMGGLPELVENGVNGFIFGDDEELLNCLVKMQNLPKAEYGKMCDCALSFAKNQFSLTGYIRKITNEYDKIKKENRDQ